MAVIIAAHNEEADLAGKLRDCLAARRDAPHEIQIVVVSDGSTDGTVAVAAAFAGQHSDVRLLALEERVGKTAAQNKAVESAGSEILLFSDVSTRFGTRFLASMLEPFADPKVGCVTGALVWTNPGASALARGTGFYWRYEHFIWRLESRLGLLAWGSGACLAVRSRLFRPVEPEYGEDCIVPLDVVAQGYRVVFQPDAIAYEPRKTTPGGEVRARARMTLRSFAGTLARRALLNPVRFPGIAWAIASHKLLRWLTPYCCLLLFVSTGYLAAQARPYRLGLELQLAFYVAGMLGYALDRARLRVPVLSTIYAFCLMNVGVCVGVAQAVLGRRIIAYASEG